MEIYPISIITQLFCEGEKRTDRRNFLNTRTPRHVHGIVRGITNPREKNGEFCIPISYGVPIAVLFSISIYLV